MTDALHRLLRTPQGVLGLVLLAGLVLACLLGGALAPYSPEAMDFAGRFAPPGARHWFGADQLGRDRHDHGQDQAGLDLVIRLEDRIDEQVPFEMEARLLPGAAGQDHAEQEEHPDLKGGSGCPERASAWQLGHELDRPSRS